MRQIELAKALIAELEARGIGADLAEASQYGQKVRLWTSDAPTMGKLVAYWGKKGPTVVSTELAAAPEGLKPVIARAVDAAIASCPGRAVQPGYGAGSGARPVPRPGSTPRPAVHPKEGEIWIWVDGSYVQRGKRRAAGWGFLVREGGRRTHAASGTGIPEEALDQRNVAGEIVAVMRALKWCTCRGVTEVTICHDYEGLAKWPTLKWKANTDFTRKYRDAVRDCGVKVHWRKVAAHTDDADNNAVDQLARTAAETLLGD